MTETPNHSEAQADLQPTAPQERPVAGAVFSEPATTRPVAAVETFDDGRTVRPSSKPKNAVKSTAQAKKDQSEADHLFPFSVTVGRVYDGPLDLLLDLIRRQDIDIYDIPIARITAQFLAYVERLKETDIDNAGEFIYTASLLIHIKSRMLLPRAAVESPDEDEGRDPRLELVERLLEHERFKNAAQMLLQKQQIEAATWTRPQLRTFLNSTDVEGEIAADVPDLVRVFRDILDRVRSRPVLDIDEDAVTVGAMIDYLRRRLLMEDRPVALSRLLANTRSERALISGFLALLEMVRLQAILLRQDANFGEVFIKKQDGFEALMEERLRGLEDNWQ